MGMTGILGQSLHRGPVAEPIVRGSGESGVCPPPRKETFAYLSVNFACNFVQERSEDAKSQVSLLHFPHPSLYQPEASCKNLVSSRL